MYFTERWKSERDLHFGRADEIGASGGETTD